MKVGYAVLYDDGLLIISNAKLNLKKTVFKDFGEFEDDAIPWNYENQDINQIKQIVINDKIKVSTMFGWFRNLRQLTEVFGLKNIDTSNCLDFANLFMNCVRLKSIYFLKDLDVSNGEDFSDMFKNCLRLEYIGSLKFWNMENAVNLAEMFYNCIRLKDMSAIENWNVSKVVNFARMCFDCKSLKNLNLSNWNLLNGKIYTDMFNSCKSLQEIVFPYTISHIKSNMFRYCWSDTRIQWKNHIYTVDDLMEYKILY